MRRRLHIYGIAIPRIIDPRPSLNDNEVFYTEDAWRARVKEQNEWDEKTFQVILSEEEEKP